MNTVYFGDLERKVFSSYSVNSYLIKYTFCGFIQGNIDHNVHFMEMYLGSSQISAMKLFCESS